MSKASKQRAVDPPLETRNSTFDIVDRAWTSRDDHTKDDGGDEWDCEHNEDDIKQNGYHDNEENIYALLPLMYPIHLWTQLALARNKYSSRIIQGKMVQQN